MISFSEPAVYKIKAQGALSEDWSDQLSGMQITVESDSSDEVIILLGLIKDQAALSGILNTLYELHLPILSVEVLKEMEG